MKRACGILLPVSSLPGKFGIGGFSKEAYDFIDCLKRAGQSYWQMLPLGPTGYGDSPYQSFTAFAGNMNYIDLQELIDEGYITEKEALEPGFDAAYTDYGKIWESREKLLRKAYESMLSSIDGLKLIELDKLREGLSDEVREYCLYQAIKKSRNGMPWYEWEEGLRLRREAALDNIRERLADETGFYEWLQILFETQFKKLKKYANESGIELIGDMPIYVSYDSADAWANPGLFRFDKDNKPTEVAGCPPDYFSPDGQLWGNPLYNWEYHARTGYKWWISRMEQAFKLYDYVRIDHFRGFDEFYAIPADAENAKEGKWLKGPGMDIFNSLSEHFADRFTEGLPIIAEDMGLITESVIRLVKDSGFPSMKVLEFAFDSDSDNIYLPHNYERNSVAYTGTHDNAPLRAWISRLPEHIRLFMIRYQGSEHTPFEDLHWDAIRTVMASISDTVIIPMQDYLGLSDEARMNEPGTQGNNWKWRMAEGSFDEGLIWHCDLLAGIYGRKPHKKAGEEKDRQAEI